jgi:hypothetical protein
MMQRLVPFLVLFFEQTLLRFGPILRERHDIVHQGNYTHHGKSTTTQLRKPTLANFKRNPQRNFYTK